jgi:hypothetical protein
MTIPRDTRAGRARWLRRGVGLLAGIALVAASACGQTKKASPAQSPESSSAPVTATALQSPTPSPTAPAPSPSPSPTRAKPSPSPSRTSPKPASPIPPPPASPTPAAILNLPQLGTYTYDLSGTTQSPLLGQPQSYPPGATLSVNFTTRTPVAGGTEVAATSSSPQDPSTTSSTKWIWQPTQVLLTFSNLTFSGLASYDCTYTPPPAILPVPLRPGALPSQSWSGSQCSGSVQANVQDEETTTAAGKSWDVWRVHTIVHYVAQSTVDVTVDSTVLFSPVLGTVVTSDTTTSGKISGNSFTSHQVTRLTGHP